ncbi:MAG: aspartyl/asparaginyl beta-hydroxylase domain-containing protein [Sphingomicrobium sp.]
MSDEAAIDALLEREPRNIEALVRKAELREEEGDDRAAHAFYQSALKAAVAAQPLAPHLHSAAQRAQQGIARGQVRFQQQLERSLEGAGFPQGSRPPRFQQSLDIMMGRAEARLELQRPTSYYLPGLPQRRYYERSELPWSAEIEAAAPVIRRELDDYLASGDDGFTPYLVNDPSRPRRELHGLVDNRAWSTLSLWEKGAPVPELAQRFRGTLAEVARLDVPRIGVRAPMIQFSRLTPGAHIPPHNGNINARLICHLPLIVPPGCAFHVGGERREWRESELLVFDDTVEHEAVNQGTSDRIILMFDVWRPEVTADERRAITALFDAVDSYRR